MNQNNTGCGIVHDLLPLYAENLTGEESRVIVEAHLLNCTLCQMELASIQVPAKTEINAMHSLHNIKSRLRTQCILIGVGSALGAVVVLFALLLFLLR